ncbi:uncharacterized protein BO80DRAFT_15094 [Aspergillus ibericus CBS 121593]|uniref:Uncharacterized protein n=1 Tax=Aspergillus ibericus CBS 121593 TaxID=1448316 RepID=A0A395HAH7_9EURO|nr:hypothetical protein BO80DRAFT_15094 [Aspergillus ibericus CBS 121593]RAL03204.1 hypothetical protein BO80DRAFT_15094 [Aspergillus ibericus CBS 121593]
MRIGYAFHSSSLESVHMQVLCVFRSPVARSSRSWTARSDAEAGHAAVAYPRLLQWAKHQHVCSLEKAKMIAPDGRQTLLPEIQTVGPNPSHFIPEYKLRKPVALRLSSLSSKVNCQGSISRITKSELPSPRDHCGFRTLSPFTLTTTASWMVNPASRLQSMFMRQN